MQIPLKGEVLLATIHRCTIVYSSEELNVSGLEVDGEGKDHLKAIGLGEIMVDECSSKMFQEPRGPLVPAYKMDEGDFKEALKVELGQLSNLGCAGWNNRLVWHHGR